MVTNGGGSPFLNKLSSGDQSAVMFLFPSDAQKMLKAVLKARRRLCTRRAAPWRRRRQGRARAPPRRGAAKARRRQERPLGAASAKTGPFGAAADQGRARVPPRPGLARRRLLFAEGLAAPLDCT